MKSMYSPMHHFILNHISIASFCETKAKSVDPDQITHNAVSDLELHCLLTELKKVPPNTPKIGNGLLQLIVVGNSTMPEAF